MSAKEYVVCSLCGKRDRSQPGHVGTALVMRCENCGGRETVNGRDVAGRAKRCRDCCVSRHRTFWAEPVDASQLTLTEALHLFCFSHRSVEKTSTHEVYDQNRIVFIGKADATWSWLRETGRIR